MPFFSIIIAAFNRAAALPRAIDSVLKQTESDYELIIVDDGSTDDTVNLIQKYWEKHENIK
ncbi:MAG: glycosyltransferase family 2 protein, partial [Chlorobi bacterium]|nr:glycosyltransferase family 2 protein [Chlorobiota bacterium]